MQPLDRRGKDPNGNRENRMTAMTLEDCARNVPKRISRLENFLRKKLSPADLSGLRYYEVCVVESKGTLLVRFVILTDDAVMVTENPPKSLIHVIRLSRIQDINLVADRRTLITGSQGNTPFVCQHVRLLYEEASLHGEQIKGIKLPADEGHGILEGGSSCSHSDEYAPRLGSITELPQFDEQSSEDGGSSGKVPQFLRRLYDPFFDLPTNSGFSPISPDSLSGKSKDGLLSDAKSLESISTSLSYDNELDLPRTNDHSKNGGFDSPRTNSALEERQASPWSNDSGFGSNDAKDRPESADTNSGELLQPKKGLLTRYLSRGSKTIKSEKPVKLFKDEPRMLTLKELNLYLYQKQSLLINELYLIWNRNRVAYGLERERHIFTVSDAREEEGQSLRVADRAISAALHQEQLLTSTTHSLRFSHLLPILVDLQGQLMQYHPLRSLCWKNTNLTGNLVKILELCVTPEEEEAEADDEDRDYEADFMERVITFSVLMDIFRLLFESCSTCFFYGQPTTRRNSQTSHMSHAMTTKNLLQLLFTQPIVSIRMPGRIKILRVIFDPQSYAKLDWTFSAESKVIKALTIAHNASVALVHEILSLIHFSPRENEKITFTSLFRKYSLEPYVKQSVTQIINLLWPSRRPLKASQCSLLYRHVYVLKLLLDNLPSVRTFVRISFCEEFQYFIHWNCIAMKVSNRFPIKPKLLEVFDELRHEVIRKEGA